MSANPGFAGIIPYRQVIGLQAGGKGYSIDTGDLAGGSMTFRHATSEAGVFSVGGAVIGGVDFTLLNDTGKFSDIDWKGATVTIVYQMTTSTNSLVNMGVYNVVHHKDSGQTIQIEAQDNMSLLDNYEIYELYNAYGLEWPADSSSVVNMIAKFNGLTTTGEKGGLILEDPGDDHMTQRACLSYIAECMGQFARIYRTTTAAIGTRIAFGWYDFNDVYDAGAAFSHNLEANDITIGAVEVTDWEGETTVKRGSGEYCIRIGGNPFISANNIEAVADNIAEAVIGMTFRPGDVSILSNPSIREGDVIRVSIGVEQKPVTVIASNITYKSQTLTESITADAETYDDLRINQSAYVKKEAKKEAEKNARKEADILISDYLADPSSKLSTAITGGARSAIGEELNNPKSDLSMAISDSSMDAEKLKQAIDDIYAMNGADSVLEGHKDVTFGQESGAVLADIEIFGSLKINGKEITGDGGGGGPGDMSRSISDLYSGGGFPLFCRPASFAEIKQWEELAKLGATFSEGMAEYTVRYSSPMMWAGWEKGPRTYGVMGAKSAPDFMKEFINLPTKEEVEFTYGDETKKWIYRPAWSDAKAAEHAPIMIGQWFRSEDEADRTKWKLRCGCYFYHISVHVPYSATFSSVAGTNDFAEAWKVQRFPLGRIYIPAADWDVWTLEDGNAAFSPKYSTMAQKFFGDLAAACSSYISTYLTIAHVSTNLDDGWTVSLPYRLDDANNDVIYDFFFAVPCTRVHGEENSMNLADTRPDDAYRVWIYRTVCGEEGTPSGNPVIMLDRTIGTWPEYMKTAIFKK